MFSLDKIQINLNTTTPSLMIRLRRAILDSMPELGKEEKSEMLAIIGSLDDAIYDTLGVELKDLEEGN
jgi:hypothetical protein